MKFLVTIYQDEDGMFIAECPAIPGCVSQGKTEREAERNIQEAIKECIKVRAEKGITTSISQARTIEEIGEFWETHSLAEYWDQTQEVEFQVRAKRRHRVRAENFETGKGEEKCKPH